MVHQNFLKQGLSVDVSVDFGRRNRLVSKHFLNNPKVGAALNEMRCKRMTESVRRNILFYSSRLAGLLYYCKNHCSGKFFAVAVEEKNVATALLRLDVVAERLHIVVDFLHCLVTDWHQPLLVAFADYADKLLAEKQVGQPQPD